MKQTDSVLIRERVSKFYLYLISFLGLFVVISSLFSFQSPSEPFIFLLLAIFIGVTEYSPVPVGKVVSALSFPLVYAMNEKFGIHTTIVAYACIMVVVSLLLRRPVRMVLFNPALLVISLALAKLFTHELSFVIVTGAEMPILLHKLTILFIFTAFYYLFNNIIIDLMLFIRPQLYTWRHWRQKTVPIALVASFSFLYASLMEMLGSQNRGASDVFTFLFFFSPLIAISLIGSSYVRIQKEKNRLKGLFSITTELNRILPSGKLNQIKGVLRGFLETGACALWMKANGDWTLLMKDGRVHADVPFSSEMQAQFEGISQTVVFPNRKLGKVPGDEFFDDVIRCLVYCPLLVENEMVGIFAVGRSRTTSFTPEEVQSLATLANQLASLLKTRILISEQEKRVILEERNRIAREIHDGIAQSLAGAVFQLESAQRKYIDKPKEMKHAVEESTRKLRVSLRDVRKSIYALRPYPTERLGLKQAIMEKVQSLKQEYGLEIGYHERGRPEQLGLMVEKVIFDTVQESLQNIVKHAKANKIEILLSYQRDHTLLKVMDDGVGFSLFETMIKAKHEPHYGILHMNEQAEKLGATLQIDSRPGKGTEIMLLIPKLEERGEENDPGYVSG